MKKIAAIIAVLAIVAGIAVVLLFSNLGKIVRQVVETVGTSVVGTEVALEDAEVSIPSASGSLSGLTIANPEGFELPHAFELGQIKFSLEPASLNTDEIVIPEINIEQAHLTFEERSGKTNLNEILGNLERAPSEETEETPEEAQDVKLVIEKFRLANAKLTVHSEKLKVPLELELPEVMLENIGRKGSGVTASEATQQIVRPILGATLKTATKGIVDNSGAILKEKAKGLLDGLKGKLGGEKKDEE